MGFLFSSLAFILFPPTASHFAYFVSTLKALDGYQLRERSVLPPSLDGQCLRPLREGPTKKYTTFSDIHFAWNENEANVLGRETDLRL